MTAPPNLDEAQLSVATAAVRDQKWCKHLADIPHYELQTLLGIGIRAYLAVAPTPAERPARSATPARKPKGPARTDSKRLQVLKRDGYVCYLCELPIAKGEESLDHVVPRARNGSSSLDNLRAAHKACNRRKGQMSLDEYRAKYPVGKSGRGTPAPKRGEP